MGKKFERVTLFCLVRFIRPIEARPQDEFVADFGPFGQVSIGFA